MLSVESIREKYPSPQRYVDDFNHDNGPVVEGQYCVGGALCLALQEAGKFDPASVPGYRPSQDSEIFYLTFPQNPAFILALQTAVPGMSRQVARDFSNRIQTFNDDYQDFDSAWEVLEEALAYQPTMQEVLATKERA